MNNGRIERYVEAMREVARRQQVGFVNVFAPTLEAMRSPGSDLTFNGIHLNETGDRQFSRLLYQGVFRDDPPQVNDALRTAIVDKNDQYFRRFRPLNTFYYTGGRNKD